MNKVLVRLLLLVSLFPSVLGCAREKLAPEPKPGAVPPVPPSSANISIGGAGGGPATTIIPSNPEENFKNAVLDADLIVSGNITSQRYEVVTVAPPKPPATDNSTGILGAYSDNVTPGKFAYTIFTLKVDKVIKGDPTTKEVFIKAPGGYIGEIYQVPTGDYFRISDQVLLTLHRENDNVFTVSSPGLVWVRGNVIISEPELSDIIGRVIRIMKANNVPVTLPQSEWPPLIEIAPPAQRPEKETILAPEQDKKTP